MREIHGVMVRGVEVDKNTRCSHYNTERDIIAIKFPCCNTYYPCHLCHEETADHVAVPWQRHEQSEHAVLCGECGHELSIEEYVQSDSKCPQCEAGFNPGCKSHYHLYFDI